MSRADSPITYRLATLEDVEALTALRREFLIEVADASESDEAVAPRLRSWFDKKLRRGEFGAVLAQVGGQVIASSGLVVHEHPPGIMIPNGREAYIMNMYTRPNWRGQGIATTIFRTLLEVAKQKDCSRVALHALPLGRTIYQKEGFVAGDKE